MAFSNKRSPSEIDLSDAPPGKRLCIRAASPPNLTDLPSSADWQNSNFPPYDKPKLDLVSIFTRLVPFQDALRQAGGLTAYDYTRLRMTCRTFAEAWKPFPYHPLEPDTRDQYFAGLKPVKCEELGCGRDSSFVAVRRCYGRYHPMAGILSGCNKFICMQCVWTAQQEYVHRKAQATEMHYCRSCSLDIEYDNPHGLPQCKCVFTMDEDINRQPLSEWQCMGCRAAFYRLFEMRARNNLMELEAEERVLPRNIHVQADGPGLERWIAKPGMNRNNCPGCGCWYRAVIESYPPSQNSPGSLPPGLLRRCMVCLDQRS